MKTNLIFIIAFILLFLANSAIAMTTNVDYGNFSFTPSDITIQAGDTVIWKNQGGAHNVVGDTPGTTLCGCAGTSIAGYTNTFTVPGDYLYHCSFHQSFGMTGIVRVVSAPLTPALLTNPVGFTNGGFTFTVISTANHTNIVQASSDLASGSNWISLSTNFPETNVFTFVDSNAALFSNRFYRVVQPQ